MIALARRVAVAASIDSSVSGWDLQPARLLARRERKLLLLGGAGQGRDRGSAALNHRGHIIEIAGADLLLVGDKGISPLRRGKLRLLHHLHIMLHAFT